MSTSDAALVTSASASAAFRLEQITATCPRQGADEPGQRPDARCVHEHIDAAEAGRRVRDSPIEQDASSVTSRSDASVYGPASFPEASSTGRAAAPRRHAATPSREASTDAPTQGTRQRRRQQVPCSAAPQVAEMRRRRARGTEIPYSSLGRHVRGVRVARSSVAPRPSGPPRREHRFPLGVSQPSPRGERGARVGNSGRDRSCPCCSSQPGAAAATTTIRRGARARRRR